jgi:transcriptional regulator with XRE-family HTH domain
MIPNASNINGLNERRKRLGMSYKVLAARSGISIATVQRILSCGNDQANFYNVVAVAKALGMTASFTERVSDIELREQQAQKKSKCLISLLQGTSGLEGQAADDQTVRDMVQQTIHELLAGSSRKLWAE